MCGADGSASQRTHVLKLLCHSFLNLKHCSSGTALPTETLLWAKPFFLDAIQGILELCTIRFLARLRILFIWGVAAAPLSGVLFAQNVVTLARGAVEDGGPATETRWHHPMSCAVGMGRLVSVRVLLPCRGVQSGKGVSR